MIKDIRKEYETLHSEREEEIEELMDEYSEKKFKA